MHLIISLLLAPLLACATTITSTTIPATPSSTTTTASTCAFSIPLATLALEPTPSQHLDLRIRQQQAATTVTASAGSSGTCPAGYFGCSNLGAPQACCSSTAICTTDAVNHVACCASGASCTGVIGAGSTGGTATANNGQGTMVATNGVIVTAGPATNGAASVAGVDGARVVGLVWAGWGLLGIVGFYGLM